MHSDILISSIVWFKVYLPNQPTPENLVKKLGPENRLISRKIQYFYWKFIQNLRAVKACPHTPEFLKVFGIINKCIFLQGR